MLVLITAHGYLSCMIDMFDESEPPRVSFGPGFESHS